MKGEKMSVFESAVIFLLIYIAIQLTMIKKR